MRVLQLVTRPQRRGAEVFAFQLSEALERRGHGTAIAYLYGDPSDGLPIRPQDRLLAGRERHPLERLPGFQPGLTRALARLSRDFRPDVVQVNGSRTVKYGSLLRRLHPGAPWALVYRNIGNPRDWLKGWVKRTVYRRWIISQLDGAVAVSRHTLDGLRQAYDLSVPAVPIPRGIEPAALVPREAREGLRSRVGTGRAAPVMLYVGNLSAEKRPDRLLRVAREVHRQAPATELWLLGDGPLRQGLARETDGGPLPVRFFGVQADVASYLNAADVLLLTSDTEGMPGVLLEAGCVGLPVVATRVGGVAECVLEGETGLLAPPEDEPALVEATVRLLRDPEQRQAMAERARRWVCENFAMARIAERYLAFYQEVLERRRRSQR